MTNNQNLMLEFAAIVVPMFLACFGGIIVIYSRLASIETKIEPIWDWWNQINGRKPK